MFVYILASKRYRKTYAGITDDLGRRLNEHNAGKETYTKRYKPWKVIYKENVDNRKEARKREKYFKSSAGRCWIKKNLFDF